MSPHACQGIFNTPKTGLDRETRDLVLQSLREFGRREFPDETLRTLDAQDSFPEKAVRRLMGEEVGLHLLFVPEEYGGLGAGARDVCRVSEELASLDLGVATSVLATALGLDPIRVGGTPEQQEYWLSKVADEGLLVAYGVTEPGAGSNVAAVKTRADRYKGDDGKDWYLINGSKCFITNGTVADVYTILARTPEGPSFFVVEKGRQGLLPGRKEDKHGIRASDTAEVVLEDVKVPADRLLGGVEGQGMAQAAKVFGYTRLMVAAFGVGGAVAAVRRAVEYARERIQFEEPLVAKQGLTHKLLIPHIVRLQAARAYIQEVAAMLDTGDGEYQVEGSVAKLFATEAGCRAADAALQVHGGYGYMREYHVEKIHRDVRITTIYEGTSEIQQEIAGRGRWKDLLLGKGQPYTELAEKMEELEAALPDIGAGSVARSAKAVVEMIGKAKKARLSRRQHVIFQLADLVSWLEVSAAFVRKTAKLIIQAREGGPGDDGMVEVFSAFSRLQAGETACKTVELCFKILAGTDTLEPAEAGRLEGVLAPAPLMACLAGQVADMDFLASELAEKDLLEDAPVGGPLS